MDFDGEGGMTVRDERRDWDGDRYRGAEEALAAMQAASQAASQAAAEGGCDSANLEVANVDESVALEGEACGPPPAKRTKGRNEFEEGDRVEAKYGTADDELWWPATVTKLWKNGDVGVLYDDGDVEPQKAACRVRHMRIGTDSKKGSGPELVLRHSRHSLALFLVGKPTGATCSSSKADANGHSPLKSPAKAAVAVTDTSLQLPKGVRLAMLEEGLFANKEDGALQKTHVHVHWLSRVADSHPTAFGSSVSSMAAFSGPLAAIASEAAAPECLAASAGTFGMQYDFSKSVATNRLLGAVDMTPAGWDERGCQLFALSASECARIRKLAHEASLAAAAEEERRREERVAADIARRGKQAIPLEEWVKGGRGRRASATRG